MHTTMRTRPLQATLTLALLVGGVGVLALHTLTGMGGGSRGGLFDHAVYGVLMGASACTVIARGVVVQAQRTAWLTMGAGLACWCLGDLYYALFVAGPSAAGGSVTPADALYLVFYPCCYVALVLLLGAHLRELRIGMWLDGLIGGLAAAAVGAALILPPILHGAHGDTASLGVALAYPIGDLLLLVFTLGALGMTGWRPGRVWLLIAVAMLCSAVADSAYLYLTATNSFHVGDWAQFLWPACAVLLAVAAWTPWPRPARRRVEDWRLVSVPSLSLLAALGVLIYGNLPHTQLTPIALVLAAVTVLTVCVHLMATVRENIAMLAGSRLLALTDPLTGLGNRRQLMEDLNVACRRVSGGETWELMLYDLNGFKRYNDTFGHPAGDALLARLSDKLRTVVAPYGTAYRMGGDEFCVLLRDCAEQIDALTDGLRRRPLRARPGLLDRRRARRGQHSPRTRGPRRGDAARGPAPLPAQGGDARGLRRAPAARRAAAGLPGAPPRPAGAPARRRRARAGGRPAPGDGRRRARRARPRRRAARRRQDRDPRRDPHQARAAQRRGVGLHEPPHDPRRADPRGRRRAAPGRAGWCAPPTSASTARATPTA